MRSRLQIPWSRRLRPVLQLCRCFTWSAFNWQFLGANMHFIIPENLFGVEILNLRALSIIKQLGWIVAHTRTSVHNVWRTLCAIFKHLFLLGQTDFISIANSTKTKNTRQFKTPINSLKITIFLKIVLVRKELI